MSSYIRIATRDACRHGKRSTCDVANNPECFIDVYIGPDILEPVRSLLRATVKVHERFIDNHYCFGEMKMKVRQHRRDYPKCKECLALDGVRNMIKKVAGRKL